MGLESPVCVLLLGLQWVAKGCAGASLRRMPAGVKDSGEFAAARRWKEVARPQAIRAATSRWPATHQRSCAGFARRSKLPPDPPRPSIGQATFQTLLAPDRSCQFLHYAWTLLNSASPGHRSGHGGLLQGF